MKVINHRPPARMMGRPQPLTIVTVMLQVRRWGTIHPSLGLPPVIHTDVAMTIADWAGGGGESAMKAFSRDGTIRAGLFNEVWTAQNSAVSVDLDFLALKALAAYLRAVGA